MGLSACSAPESASPEAPAVSIDHAESIDRFIEQVIAAHDLPGVAASVVRDGKVTYSRAFGVESVESGEVLSPEHLFHFASVSKPFAATAIMQLVEDGLMELDAPVIRYLPYFELADGPYEEITIRQMLNHTSGMPDVEDYEWDQPQTDEGAAERYVRSLTSESMIGPPGGQWQYSNMAFDTLGDVIAKVSGQSFEDYIKEHILDPLGMRESNFLYPATREDLRTSGHTWNMGPVLTAHYPYNRRHAPSSTLNSSVAEMTAWALANLNRGELNGVRILEESSYDLLWTPSAEVEEGESVGLSWFIEEHSGTRMISHDGGDEGYSSYLVLLPDQGVGFTLASNTDQAPMGLLRDGLLDILEGIEPPTPLRPIRYDFAMAHSQGGIEAAIEFYRNAVAERSEDYFFSARQLNSFGYFLLQAGEIDGAIEVFAFNVELYPEEGNPYDSLGEAYLAGGNVEQARINYSRALELDPDNDYARSVLADMADAASSNDG